MPSPFTRPRRGPGYQPVRLLVDPSQRARQVPCAKRGARLRAEGNALCTQCHDRQTFDGPRHHFHAVGTDGARCVNYLMPSRTYMAVHERRDHRIAVPRPDLSATLG